MTGLRHIRLMLALVAVVLGIAVAAPAPATAQDNAAVAVNTKDHNTASDIAFNLARVLNGDVDQTNAAVAYASCTDCRTVALAIQVVLVMGEVESVTPQNIAIAINENCTACETLASAYQLVLGGPGRVRLTGDARHRIAEILLALRTLVRSDVPLEQMQAQFDQLANQLFDTVRTGLVPIGSPPDERAPGDHEGADANERPPDAPAEPAPTATPETDAPPSGEAPPAESPPPSNPTPAPAGTATPEPTPDAPATPTPTPEPSITPEPTPTPTPTP